MDSASKSDRFALLTSVGRSESTGIEQKQNVEATLPLPEEETETWIAQLTDIWRHCPGMRETVAREAAKTAAMRTQLQEIFTTQGRREP